MATTEEKKETEEQLAGEEGENSQLRESLEAAPGSQKFITCTHRNFTF